MPGLDMNQWAETAKKVLEPITKGFQEGCEVLKSSVEAQAPEKTEQPQKKAEKTSKEDDKAAQPEAQDSADPSKKAQ